MAVRHAGMASDELRGFSPPQSAGKSPSAYPGLNSASEVRERGREAEEGPQRREPDVEPGHQARDDDRHRQAAEAVDLGEESRSKSRFHETTGAPSAGRARCPVRLRRKSLGIEIRRLMKFRPFSSSSRTSSHRDATSMPENVAPHFSARISRPLGLEIATKEPAQPSDAEKSNHRRATEKSRPENGPFGRKRARRNFGSISCVPMKEIDAEIRQTSVVVRNRLGPYNF